MCYEKKNSHQNENSNFQVQVLVMVRTIQTKIQMMELILLLFFFFFKMSQIINFILFSRDNKNVSNIIIKIEFYNYQWIKMN